MFTSVSPTCAPCGHVMQPVGPRTLHERQIGGAPVAFWHGQEYECVSCRTRTVLVDSRPSAKGSVGYEATVRAAERVAGIPAQRVISAEHLPAGVRRDSTRDGGRIHLSQRQQAARLVEEFFSDDDAPGPLDTLIRIADVLRIDISACLPKRAASIAVRCEVCNTPQVDGRCPAPVCQPENDVPLPPRDAEGRIIGARDYDLWLPEGA